MKNCRKCNLMKSLDDFYVHKAMLDGHLNICKVCVKNRVSERYTEMVTDPAFVEKERARGRDKFQRLYKGKVFTPENKSVYMKKYNQLYPEKYRAKIKSQRIDIEKGLERHHWSYRPEHAKDIIPLPVPDHAMIHRFIVYDQNNMMYRTNDGQLLDTREKHEQFILSLIKKSA